MLNYLIKRFQRKANTNVPPPPPISIAREYLIAGQSTKAVSLLENILHDDPRDAEALNLLGRALFQENLMIEAKEKIRQAIEITPDGPGFHCNMAEVLEGMGDKIGAENAYKTQIKRTPKFEQGYIALSKFYAAAGKGDDVVKTLQKGLQEIPDSDSVRLLLAYYRNYVKDDFRGMLQTLAPLFERNPEHTQAQLYAARAYMALSEYSNCERFLRDIVKREPDHVDALIGLGQLMLTVVKADEGEACLRLALGIDPDNIPAAELLIALFLETNQLERAADLIAVFSHQYPDNPSFYCYKGRLALLTESFDECKLNMLRALEIDPQYIPALEYLANLNLKMGDLEEAITGYKTALAIEPQRPLSNYNYGLALLSAGKFKQGLAHYEWRLQLAYAEGTPFKLRSIFFARLQGTKDIPGWDGKSSLKGKRLLIWGEQGLGDQIMMLRFLRQLRALKPQSIHLMANREIEALAQSTGLLDGTIPIDEWQTDKSASFDLKCSSMSLPYLLKAGLSDLGRSVPYLTPAKDRADRMREVLAGAVKFKHTAVKVGLVWAGNPALADDKLRSIALERLKPLLDIPDIQWVSLQKGACQDDIRNGQWPLLDVMDQCKDFADTAALIECLDLVIAVDTSVIHLAGALGKQSWLFNRAGSEWRWMRNREDSPWYPTVKIFNQGKSERWEDVIQRMIPDLELLVRNHIQTRTNTAS
ncbi:MAG TPA: tetratricopeptide repeat protein [Rhodocyclaceae bacterium]|nr:tetratricopeptide repeat protein [Rhodocyclaceae bacterium]